DPRAFAPAVDVEYIVACGDTPVDVSAQLVRPPLDVREQALRARPVAQHEVISNLGGAELRALAVLHPDRNQVLGPRAHADVRLVCVDVARKPLVGLACNRRGGQVPAESEGPVAGAGVVAQPE